MASSAESSTGFQIRQVARTLLTERGPAGVTLRAIARTLGITAPALYRYYSSHSALLDRVRTDICIDLADELTEDIAKHPEHDGLAQFFGVCRGFRRWALANPTEFTLVFASMNTGDAISGATEPFGRVFISSVGKVLATHELAGVPDDVVPTALRDDVESFRSTVLSRIATGEESESAERRLTLGVAYILVQYWTRIYGHVSLEVSGGFPMAVSDPDALFNAMLADLVREIGLGPA